MEPWSGGWERREREGGGVWEIEGGGGGNLVFPVFGGGGGYALIDCARKSSILCYWQCPLFPKIMLEIMLISCMLKTEKKNPKQTNNASLKNQNAATSCSIISHCFLKAQRDNKMLFFDETPTLQSSVKYRVSSDVYRSRSD